MSKKKKRRPEPADPSQDIVGTWVRDARDDAPYPDEITFDRDGIYSGKKAPGSLVASKLDAGIFDRIDEKSIRMSTATDREETFAVDVSEDALVLVDEEGKELSYKRRSEDEAPAMVSPDSPPEAEAEPDQRVDTGTEEWTP
jgi:hypothetical protein